MHTLVPLNVTLNVSPCVLVTVFPTIGKCFFVPGCPAMMTTVGFSHANAAGVNGCILGRSFVVPNVMSAIMTVMLKLLFVRFCWARGVVGLGGRLIVGRLGGLDLVMISLLFSIALTFTTKGPGVRVLTANKAVTKANASTASAGCATKRMTVDALLSTMPKLGSVTGMANRRVMGVNSRSVGSTI